MLNDFLCKHGASEESFAQTGYSCDHQTSCQCNGARASTRNGGYLVGLAYEMISRLAPMNFGNMELSQFRRPWVCASVLHGPEI